MASQASQFVYHFRAMESVFTESLVRAVFACPLDYIEHVESVLEKKPNGYDREKVVIFEDGSKALLVRKDGNVDACVLP